MRAALPVGVVIARRAIKSVTVLLLLLPALLQTHSTPVAGSQHFAAAMSKLCSDDAWNGNGRHARAAEGRCSSIRWADCFASPVHGKQVACSCAVTYLPKP
jgi:hypothetical protein